MKGARWSQGLSMELMSRALMVSIGKPVQPASLPETSQVAHSHARLRPQCREPGQQESPALWSASAPQLYLWFLLQPGGQQRA